MYEVITFDKIIILSHNLSIKIYIPKLIPIFTTSVWYNMVFEKLNSDKIIVKCGCKSFDVIRIFSLIFLCLLIFYLKLI